MRDEITLETPEQIRALAHPLRQRIIHALTDAPYTNKQLATRFNVSPPRLYFHVRELLAAGLIEIVSEQPKGGVIEKYYRAVARVMRLGTQTRQAANEEDLLAKSLEVVRQEFMQANAYFDNHFPQLSFAHEPVRISTERLERIQGHLAAIHEEMYQAMQDPQRETREHFVAISYLLHTLPTITEDAVPLPGVKE
ncbi:winged helix-turn-helix domain-containing protein [Dictyobacter formicarum]|uniref:HTH arsR-type domain-containing protein n=1 Tax=Dictyobacter formicarum TaxID=2778368 RepID=A0ABQ3VG12_9CHLR|nr:winged helix-turn-helix domain-containing protein [Dictyobacter formicarum]GHO84940.1 hypothetical protein KSZ_29460 [Dictyobacter formicarum]